MNIIGDEPMSSSIIAVILYSMVFHLTEMSTERISCEGICKDYVRAIFYSLLFSESV